MTQTNLQASITPPNRQYTTTDHAPRSHCLCRVCPCDDDRDAKEDDCEDVFLSPMYHRTWRKEALRQGSIERRRTITWPPRAFDRRYDIEFGKGRVESKEQIYPILMTSEEKHMIEVEAEAYYVPDFRFRLLSPQCYFAH